MKRTPLAASIAAVAALAAGLSLPGSAQEEPAAAPPPSLANLTPSGAPLYVSLADLVAAREALGGTDLGKVWKSLAPFVDGMWRGLEPVWVDAQSQFEHETGVPLGEALQALGGGVEAAAVGLNKLGDPEGFVALIRAEGREDQVHALVERMRARTAGPERGAPTFHVGGIPGAIIVAETPDLLKRVVDAATHKAAAGFAPLSQAPDFQAVRSKLVPQGHAPVAYAYLNLAPLIERAVQKDPGSAKALYQTGLRDVRALGLGVTAHEGKIATAAVVHAPAEERRGLFPILNHGPVDAAALAKLAPASAVGFSAVRFDLGAAYDRALALIDAVEPKAGQDVRAQIAEFERRAQMSIRSDLLAALGADWAAYAVIPEGGGSPASIAGVPVKDEKIADEALRALARAVGFEVREVVRGGKRIRYAVAPLGRLGQDPFRGMERDPMAVARTAIGFLLGTSWTVEGGRLWLADMPQTFEEAWAGTRAGGSLADAPEFQAALRQATPGAGYFAYFDPRPSVPALWNGGLKLARMFEGILRTAGVPIDLALLPRGAAVAGLLTPGMADLAIDADGLAIRSRAALAGPDVSVATIAVIAAIAIPNLIEARKGSNEAAAIGALRVLTTAQALYREGDKDKDGVLDYATSLAELRDVHLIDPVLGSGVKLGYRFEVRSLGDPQFQWEAIAVPVQQGKTGDRAFFVDESGVIRFSTDPETIGPESPPIGG